MANASIGKDSLVSLTANIVSANVSNNPMGVGDLCDMIKSVHSALSSLASREEAAVHEESAGPPKAHREPAVPIEASITPEYIVCLEDGKKLKTLKRYLRSRYQLTPEEYRAKWGLPADYPMAAPNYTNQRREMARKIGLGLRPRATGKGVISKPAREDAEGTSSRTPARRRGSSH